MLGEYEVFHGDWLKLFDAPAQFARVTREQVQSVAREILDRRKRTVGVLLPEEPDSSDRPAGEAGLRGT